MHDCRISGNILQCEWLVEIIRKINILLIFLIIPTSHSPFVFLAFLNLRCLAMKLPMEPASVVSQLELLVASIAELSVPSFVLETRSTPVTIASAIVVTSSLEIVEDEIIISYLLSLSWGKLRLYVDFWLRSLFRAIATSRCDFGGWIEFLFAVMFSKKNFPPTTLDDPLFPYFSNLEIRRIVDDFNCVLRIYLCSTSTDKHVETDVKVLYTLDWDLSWVNAISRLASDFIPDLKFWTFVASSIPMLPLFPASSSVLCAVLWIVIYFSKLNLFVSSLYHVFVNLLNASSRWRSTKSRPSNNLINEPHTSLPSLVVSSEHIWL